MRILWAEQAALDLPREVTLMETIPQATAEERFLSKLASIDLHHGPCSTAMPYTELEVIGCELTPPVRGALENLGFRDFAKSMGFFVARRSLDAAIGAY